MSLETLFGVAYLLSAAVSLWSLAQLNRFLKDTPEISDEACLERFKALARLQMYLALAMIVLLVAGMIAGLVLITRHGLFGLAVVLLTNVVVLGLGLYHKRVEVKTRTLRAGSERLAQEYRRVAETWVKKALPDF